MPVESTRAAQAVTDPHLIETMRFENGRIALWSGHLSRLQTSSAALGFAWRPRTVGEYVLRHCADLDPGTVWRVRLLLARDGSCHIESSILAPTPAPVRLALAPQPISADIQWLMHKTTHRSWYGPAESWLREHHDVFDVIHTNPNGEITEGSRSNIYVQDGHGAWLTPPIESGLLPGVQRQALLDEGRVRIATLSTQDLRSASALRVSNALRGWLDARL